ncbi:cell division ATP-binding protein FtsE [Patescibacteria group bacterium]|nr:cell division ATP-binding protein FtsE [Patescibacteria group bacterium]MBU4367358.1 cell division ATP-binding protein FtsE [Patescibacteria group bacterium]MBU4461977.1 cell division ATP-binding protein FtsE [Patescibacteria group bacterium]MCG2699658.1 cell division ATP-binding protein FtsE [Candidatus Parcubacteria bacterium]
MIKFQNVTKTYPPDTTVLNNVSFEIKLGEFVSIVGKSGAGKTTLIRLLLGLEKPTSGQILFKETNILHKKRSQLQELRQKIGVIYQDYKLLGHKTVYENIAYVMAVKGEKDEKIKKEVANILEITGLSAKADNFPNELSGGEQQRLAVARAIVNQPDVIVADEPTGNLDPYNTYEVISLLNKFHETGKTVIFASHNKEIINKLGKRVITLEEGKVIRDDKKGRFIL